MKLHQYLFSFLHPGGAGVGVTLGLQEQRVTQADINKARAGAGVDANLPLVAVSYLGHMTMAEFKGQ
ncbi:hypothetical protein [Pseudomonas hunanensis]|uniref:hypothetical protein n=1 Tax=Pseudomonas hunanensis TaxID=1247546 RepID=UPI0030D70BD6